jgi:lysozyme family protein
MKRSLIVILLASLAIPLGASYGACHNYSSTYYPVYSGSDYYYSHPYSYSSVYVNPGSDAAVSVSVQRRLANLGYYHGDIDGVVGPQTRSAIYNYKHAQGLHADSYITQDLINSLGIS